MEQGHGTGLQAGIGDVSRHRDGRKLETTKRRGFVPLLLLTTAPMDRTFLFSFETAGPVVSRSSIQSYLPVTC